jgi:uncharacterized protein (TIGR02246 family)
VGNVSDHDEIRGLVASYCQCCDDGRFEEFAQLFAPDAQFAVMGKVHEGREAIVGFMGAAMTPERRGKHLTSNTLIDLDADNAEATALTDYMFVARRSEGGFAITSVGRYHDRVVRSPDGGWQFARREIVFMGDVPSDAGAQPLAG